MARDGRTGSRDDQSAIMTRSPLPRIVQAGGPHRRPRPRGDAPGGGGPGRGSAGSGVRAAWRHGQVPGHLCACGAPGSGKL